ncbi:MAG: nitrous oxide reductase family maturation protein NosD [Ktedonobacterales bacterium]
MTDHVVDPCGSRTFVTISEALTAADPGDCVLIRPGVYRESLVVAKSVELVGQGDRRDIVIEAVGESVLRITQTTGRIARLTLRQLGEPSARIGVEVVEAQVILEYCDVFSECAVCLDICTDEHCVVQHNRIHGSSDAGIVLVETSSCIVACNDIFNHARAGITVVGGKPTVRRNRVHNNHGFGILNLDGRARIERNHIYANRFAGVYIPGGMPELRGNRIAHGEESGVFVDHHGRAILEDNRIVFNRFFGVDVSGTSYVTLRHNQIANNRWAAVSFSPGSNGTLDDNEIRDADDG